MQGKLRKTEFGNAESAAVLLSRKNLARSQTRPGLRLSPLPPAQAEKNFSEIVTLDAAQSYDPAGASALNYSWSCIEAASQFACRDQHAGIELGFDQSALTTLDTSKLLPGIYTMLLTVNSTDFRIAKASIQVEIAAQNVAFANIYPARKVTNDNKGVPGLFPKQVLA